MEHSKNREIQVLAVVEGKSAEPRFLKRLFCVYETHFHIYSYGTNIYDLYRRMKSYDFQCDVKDALLEKAETAEEKELLDRKFAYTYLIFDCDLHHRNKTQSGESYDKTVQSNLAHLTEMAAYFTDETDPSVGRLYLNYPMLESYRDCDSFFDEGYQNNTISVDRTRDYKQIVARRKLTRVHLDTYSRENFDGLTKMNVYKLNSLMSGIWGKPEYSLYRDLSQTDKILKKQMDLLKQKRELSVLNTSLFMMLDYYGQRDGFYDRVMDWEDLHQKTVAVPSGPQG